MDSWDHKRAPVSIGANGYKRLQWQCRLKSCSEVKEAEARPLCPKHKRAMIGRD